MFARSERHGLRVVVDTNVWISALITPNGRPGSILEAIRRGDVEAVASWELADELADVLARPPMRRYRIEDRHIVDVLILFAPFLPQVEVDVEIRDPKDAAVVSSAIAGAAAAIVTGDRHLLGDEDLRAWLAGRRVQLLTVVELLELL